MRPTRIATILAACALLIALVACEAAPVVVFGEGDYQATTEVGKPVPVRVAYRGGCSQDLVGDAGEAGEWRIKPAKGATITDGMFVATVPGVYTVTRTMTERDNEEATPSKITVKPATSAEKSGAGGGEVSLMEDVGEPVRLFEINSLMGVKNGPPSPTVFTLETPALITEIMDYHYNDGRGASPGSIGLEAADGTRYGPWKVEITTEGQGGVPNAYWYAKPGTEISAGTYTIIDSDPPSWSWNEETGGRGISFVTGVPK